MNPPEILKLHNRGNFAARDVILNGDYSNVNVSADFAGVRRDSLHANSLRHSVYIVAGRYVSWRALCQSSRLPVKLNERYGRL